MICIILLLVGVIAALYLSRLLELREYSLEYRDTIAEYAQEYSLDPYLVAAVIHCESSGDPNAVSRSGARGLMQVMPATGTWIAEKLEIGNYDDDRLFEPELNIRFGCWYLRFLSERFDGNLINIIAAYNAGQGNVEEWLKDASISSDGQLEDIPFDETAKYVKKVQRACQKYMELYPESF